MAFTSWTLARNGHRVTCTLIPQPSGYCILRLTHRGHHILDERCEGPQHAMSRSFDAFNALLTRGWLDESSVN